MHSKGEFRKLLLSSFISQSGSHFLTLALAAFILVSSGSPIQSALVFVVSYLPSILVSSQLGHWIDTKVSRWLLARNELISIVSTILCGLIVAYKLPLVLLCLVLGFRSLLMFISRAASTKWLKNITPPELQTNRIKVFYLSFFLSTALAGVLLGFVVAKASIWKIVTIDILSYVVSTIVIMTLQELPKSQYATPLTDGTFQPKLFETLITIFRMPLVRNSFLIVCFSQSLFQGAYSALVSLLPIQHFNVGMAGVGSFQIAASIGITGGFLVNWLWDKFFNEKEGKIPARALMTSFVAVLCLLTAISTDAMTVSIVAFLGLNFFYECVWLHHNSEFFRASPKMGAARYQFTLSACAAFLMSCSTLGYSAAIEYWGLIPGTVAVLGIGVFVIVSTSLVARNMGEVKDEVITK